ncbi:MAG TPA: FAD-binding protein [Planctomycetota bacterium]|nr:FAD-binding protein [Planctomycetota bacterium]HRR80639.1 FAD-binding protein [Planctomycetota bacterium]
MKLCEGVTTHDALIIGSGLAGMAAAIEAHDAGARVAILSKVHPLRSHSQAAQGGINAAIRPDDDWRDHRFDTIKGSAWLADQDAVTVLCREAPDAIWWLAACGVPFSRTSDGLLAQRPFGGQRRDRTCYAADKTGHDLLHTLYEQVQRRGITVYEEFCVTRLVPGQGGWPSLVAWDVCGGAVRAFAAPAILIATGGAGRVYGQSSNALINTGDGVAMAWRAGLPVEDMEFFQIHPTGLLNGILMTEGCRGEGAYLVNAKGERFMERYAPKFMELAPRDQVARAIQTEINEGRGFPGSGGYVHLDLRHLGEEKIAARLPQIREIAIAFGGVDPVKEPIPVRPTVHYTMGGIATDTDCRTECPGLFAAGEAACVSVHGANRLGGNSLLEAVVYGRRAGRTIAAASRPGGPPTDAAARDEHARLMGILRREGGERPVAVRTAMEAAMRRSFGLFRNRELMSQGLDEILALRERAERVAVQDKGRTFNHDLFLVLQLEAMLDVAWMCAAGAIRREESRGCHYRNDFERLDNERFLKHTLARRAPDGSMALSYKAVTIEDITPQAEVKY